MEKLAISKLSAWPLQTTFTFFTCKFVFTFVARRGAKCPKNCHALKSYECKNYIEKQNTWYNLCRSKIVLAKMEHILSFLSFFTFFFFFGWLLGVLMAKPSPFLPETINNLEMLFLCIIGLQIPTKNTAPKWKWLTYEQRLNNVFPFVSGN